MAQARCAAPEVYSKFSVFSLNAPLGAQWCQHPLRARSKKTLGFLYSQFDKEAAGHRACTAPSHSAGEQRRTAARAGSIFHFPSARTGPLEQGQERGSFRQPPSNFRLSLAKRNRNPEGEKGSEVPCINCTDQGVQIEKWSRADTNEREILTHLVCSQGQAEGPGHLLASYSSSSSASKSLMAQITAQNPTE